MEQDERISGHFEKISDAFDGVYEGRQESLLYKMVDILFRAVILKKRKDIIVGLCGNPKGKSVLDIGCGSGRYSLDTAINGASSVLGIDISQPMIKLSQDLAVANGVESIAKFKNQDFMDKDFKERFDIIIVSGVFDYVAKPQEFLNKIYRQCNERAVISFPVKWTMLTPLRMAWLYKRQCPNFYYTKRQIKKLINQSGLKLLFIGKIGSFLVPGTYIVLCSHSFSEQNG